MSVSSKTPLESFPQHHFSFSCHEEMEAPQLAISLVRMLDDIKCCNETIDEAYCSPAMENDRPICAVRPHASERGDILEH